MVEIDETKVSKRKYNRGRLLRDEWIVGAFDRDTGNVRLAIISSRNQEVLGNFIVDNIEPGSTIISDEWRGYSERATAGYWHVTVNHSVNYVDPRDSTVHTNTFKDCGDH